MSSLSTSGRQQIEVEVGTIFKVDLFNNQSTDLRYVNIFGKLVSRFVICPWHIVIYFCSVTLKIGSHCETHLNYSPTVISTNGDRFVFRNLYGSPKSWHHFAHSSEYNTRNPINWWIGCTSRPQLQAIVRIEIAAKRREIDQTFVLRSIGKLWKSFRFFNVWHYCRVTIFCLLAGLRPS